MEDLELFSNPILPPHYIKKYPISQVKPHHFEYWCTIKYSGVDGQCTYCMSWQALPFWSCPKDSKRAKLSRQVTLTINHPIVLYCAVILHMVLIDRVVFFYNGVVKCWEWNLLDEPASLEEAVLEPGSISCDICWSAMRLAGCGPPFSWKRECNYQFPCMWPVNAHLTFI